MTDHLSGQDPVDDAPGDAHEPPDETAHLLRSPRNARRLPAAIDGLQSGNGTDHQLAETSTAD